MVIRMKPGFTNRQQGPEETIEEQICRRRAMGISVRNIAKAMHLGYEKVRVVLHEAGMIEPSTDFDWPDEALEFAEAQWALGVSAGTIAGAINAQYGAQVSRSAVLGKLDRGGNKSGAGPRGNRVKRVKPPSAATEPRQHGGARGSGATAPTLPPADALEPLGPVADFPAGDTCRYVYGDPGMDRDWRMCGRPGKPYCESHRARLKEKPKTPVSAGYAGRM